MKKVIVIGGGFAGISSACHLAKKGYDVTILEKNDQLGGRASQFQKKGFTFDMGPSWYWMPDVFEKFFNSFGKSVSDYYELVRLDPSYAVHFSDGSKLDIPAQMQLIRELFESVERGSAENLDKFLAEAKYKYEVGINEFVYKPGNGISEFLDLRVIKSAFKLQMLTSVAKQIDRLFKHENLRELLKFPVLFLGATPENTPALYSLMNYADFALGTWYPMGGMYEIVKAMRSVAEELGVKIECNECVTSIEVQKGSAKIVVTENNSYNADIVVGGADYHHIDQNILDREYRNYSPKYWDNRTLAPSSILYFVGVNRKLDGLQHHNLFFDADFPNHAHEVYQDPKWPTDPLFYVCCPSQTDSSVAPEGCENLFILIPTATNLTGDDEVCREHYYNVVMDRLEKKIGQDIRSHVVVKESFAHSDFKNRYNSFKGNAYGLANTLRQTAFLKPKLKNKKVKNLFYTGQLTVPGPGVPPSIISGEVVATEIDKIFKS